MDKYLLFIEQYCPEHRFYWRTQNIYCKEQNFEIFFNQKPKCGWEVRLGQESPWQAVDRKQLLILLQQEKSDLVVLESEIVSSIKSLLIFSHMMQKEAKVLFGENIIRDSIKEFDQFSQTLTQTIHHLLAQKEKNNPTTVKTKKTKRSLRLLK